MKKFMLTAFVALIVMVSVNAQEGVFRLGGSVGYSSEIEEIGYSVDLVYSINDTWEVAADYSFIPEIDDMVKFSFIDINAHYMISESFYALAGVDFATAKVDFVLFDESFSESDSETGANIGLGGRFSLSDSLSFFTEAKYVTTYDGLFNIRAGILFSF